MNKTLVKKPVGLTPDLAVKKAYQLTMTPEAMARLKEIKEAVEYAEEQTAIATKITIKDDASNQAAADVVVNLAKTSRVVEDLRKYYTDPLEKAKKGIIAVFKQLGADAAGQEDRLRKELGEYYQQKENKRREDEAKRIAADQEAQRKARALGRAAPKPIASAPAPEVAKTTEAENGSAGVSLYWGFDLVTPAAVPRQYCTVDEKLIRQAVADGVREIPGVFISERPRVAVR